ncbi:guanylate kinase [Micromonospora rhizosphaerae]|uniref:Guanylate kinase n=1 Tax=Micromonospora rhizosphaerae TaxID=568872 RepID=A0A1C6RFM2_9ACTN|nr:kinase [Micromonospora rhizosphaerae]SCL15967.1 guanylate kinase [Micromonospora rhizosphaerae]
MRGVILYGPPAAGKDTITQALSDLDPAYRLFRRLKAGPGRAVGYRMTTPEHVDQLRAAGDVVWENHRYGAVYAVDRPTLQAGLLDHVPVLHLGQVEAVQAVKSAVPEARWLVVYLWCPREVAEDRILARATGDTADRLQAWDQTQPLSGADLAIDTATVAPDEAARQVHERLTQFAGCA